MALTDKLSAIGVAIREKTGGTELLTLDAMPDEIRGIQTGGAEVEPVVLTGDCSYACANAAIWQYINLFGDTITTKDISNATYMFYLYDNETVPFDLNFKSDSSYYGTNDITYLFNGSKMYEPPKVSNVNPKGLSYLFAGCYYLRSVPNDWCDDWNWNYLETMTSAYSGMSNLIFSGCYSLRSFPVALFAHGNPVVNSSYNCYASAFDRCYVLDEAINMPVPVRTSAATSNLFGSTFKNCYRLKNMTFETNEDGTSKTAEWKAQTIDLTSVGVSASIAVITDYNSGITADKQVSDDATYQALKDDPDWFSLSADYSRYNHDSAVATINSLPDTSAYLATAGGTNTIKFLGTLGSSTDGGAINTLTEEEIAVAAAKGWTVTIS